MKWETVCNPQSLSNDYPEPILNSLSEGILIVSPQGQIISYNTAAVKILKINFSQIKNFRIQSLAGNNWKFLKSDNTELLITDSCIQQILQGQRPIKEQEVRLSWKNNPVIWLCINIIPLNDSKGELKSLVITFRDISTIKEMKSQLSELAEFNEKLMDNSTQNIILHDLDSSIKYASAGIEKLIGYSKTEITGMKAPYPWWPAEKSVKLTREFYKCFKQSIHRVEMCIQKKNGEKLWIEASSAPIILDNQTRYLITSIIDITEQKRLREEREFYLRESTRIQEEERKRIARELHDETAQSLAYLALELDYLINNNRITSDVLNKRLAELKIQVDNSLKEVHRFSHELRSGVLDQLGLVAALETLLDELNTRTQVKVSFNVSGIKRRLPSEVELALFRITQEALSNIRKHSQATQAQVSLCLLKDKVKMTIEDNGKGFPAEDLDQIMLKGRLGLIGMRERARLINGVLSIKSQPDKGTSVLIEVPGTHHN